MLTGAGRPAVRPDRVPQAALSTPPPAKLTDIPGDGHAGPAAGGHEVPKDLPEGHPHLKSPDAIKLAAQMDVVGPQHQAILRYVLGLYPVGSGVVRKPRTLPPPTPSPP